AREWGRRNLPRADIAREVQAMLRRLVEQNAPGSRSGEPQIPLKFAEGGMLGFEFLRQFHFLAERAAHPNGWVAPEDHPAVQRLQRGYDQINALDERVSFYRDGYKHVVSPEDFRRYAAVSAHWRFDAIAALCERMQQEVDAGFAALLK
ncbi:MAG TPA: hypothetical protein VF678_03695, partial [bacterium]